MGFCSFISSVASSVGSAISSAVSSVGNFVSDVAKTVSADIINPLKNILDLSVKTLTLVSNVIEFVAKKLGIIEDESVEDIGDRAMRSDKSRDEFESVNDYIDYLKEGVEPLDKNELENLSKEERLKRMAVGSALLSKAIEEKKSLEIPITFWQLSVEKGLSAKEIDNFLNKFQNAGVAPVDFVKYLKKELEFEKDKEIKNILFDGYKELNPKIEDLDIKEKIILLKGI